MFVVNEDNSIYATRGDIVFFSVTANDNGEAHQFQAGDVLRVKIYEKKAADKVVLQKDFPVLEATESVEIFLTEEDTKLGEVISKPKDYWYEVELNPYDNPQTIIGYNEDGATVFKLFPEGDDIPEFVPDPEDFRVMDDELDMTSTRPVENQAVARAVVSLRGLAEDTAEGLAIEKARFDNLISEDNTTVSKNLEYMDYITENTKAKVDAHIESDGVRASIKVNHREANFLVGGSNMDVFIIPKECRPINTGLIHTEDGMEYSINYDTTRESYVLNMRAEDTAVAAPAEAGTVTLTYALGDYELKDVRVGADGKIYPTAGEAVRATAKNVFELLEATKLAQPIIPFMDRLEIGFVQIDPSGLTYKEYTNYIRTKEGVTIHLEKGDKITCANETRVYAGYLNGMEYVQIPWTSNFVAPESADYVLLFSDYPIADIDSLDAFLHNITISRAVNYSTQIDSLRKDTDHLLRLENTYLSKCDLAVGDAATTNEKRYCAKLETPVYGMKISMPNTVRYGIQGYSDSAYTKKEYDSGWRTDEGFVIFENPELHYVVIFIRLDDTNPTVGDRSNTVVLQAVSLTPVLDKLNAYSSASTLAHYDSTNDLIRSVAHRGLSDSAPENTAPAFVLAKQAGFTYVETDIQVTKDGKYVCVHDATIRKYTSGQEVGAVSDYTLAELQAMDFGAWKGEKWAGTKILTFEEFVLLCKKLGVKPYIELKYTHSEADVAYYLEYVKKMGIANDCVWRGAAYNTVIRALSDTSMLAYDASSIMTEEKVSQIVERYAPLFFHNDSSYVTKSVVELCHNNGVRIEVYTVNDEETLNGLVEMGVDGITTDKLLAGKVLFEKLL